MFFIASKTLWFLVQPVTLIFLLLVLVALQNFGRLRVLGRLAISAAILCLGLGAFSTLGFVALQPLESAFERPAPPARITGIIVLGGGLETDINSVRQGYEFNHSGDRYVEALRLAQLYPDARLLISGGSGALFPSEETEAASGLRFFTAFGIDPARIITEDQSRNTEENAQLTREKLAPAPGDTWLLVTSAFHMPRSVGLFRKAGFDVVPWPADYLTKSNEGFGLRLNQPAENLSVTSIALREWIGLFAYWLTGKIDSPLPRP